jgi:predicted N-acetyltransferase YhbS
VSPLVVPSAGSAAIRPFEPGDMPAVIALLEQESWETYTQDARRTLLALTAPGATSLLALADGGRVAGIALAVGDGHINAYLALLVVRREQRRRGIGRALTYEVLRRAGALRLDLLSGCDAFYAALGAEPIAGFRIRAEQLPPPE